MENVIMGRDLTLRARGYIMSAIAAAWIFVTPAVSSAADSTSLEYQIKAALLIKFGSYVDWPRTAFSAPNSPLNVCVAGEDPFGDILDSTASGQRVDERPVQIRRVKAVARDSGCHILFVASDSQRTVQALEGLRGAGMLTVTDSGTGGGAGIIDFVVRDNRVRFDINDDAAAQNGLAISSKLLSLAQNVKPRRKEAR
jgi:hypothetical protein